MTQYENDVERYLDEIAELLPASEKETERFLMHFTEEIFRYEAETGREVDYKELIRYFGTPSEIVKSYATAWESEFEDAKHAVIRRFPWLTVVFWICVILLLVCVAWMVYCSARAFLAYNGAYVTIAGKH